jgi:tRNA pseudouridine32 synthase/23S rRNA pseudouridine746 synthase/23S rRNA pseudouridine1911/1915/1917 synthase
MKIRSSIDQTLLEVLAELSPESSKTSQRSWIKEGRITVDGQVIKSPTAIIHAGQEVALGVRPKLIEEGKLRILYEDRHLVVIEKPTGLLSVATNFEKAETAHALLKKKYSHKVFVVHRLDQDTSGVMLFALNETARDQLKLLFEKHEIVRSYTAIVEGHLETRSGTWQSYLREDENYVVYSTPETENSQLATTHYTVLSSSKRYTKLELNLETGRKNQIRVHCQDAGHPVAGDTKYGAQTNPIHRLCLHAHLLTFIHPITKQKMRFESPLPPIFQKIVS